MRRHCNVHIHITCICLAQADAATTKSCTKCSSSDTKNRLLCCYPPIPPCAEVLEGKVAHQVQKAASHKQGGICPDTATIIRTTVQTDVMAGAALHVWKKRLAGVHMSAADALLLDAEFSAFSAAARQEAATTMRDAMRGAVGLDQPDKEFLEYCLSQRRAKIAAATSSAAHKAAKFLLEGWSKADVAELHDNVKDELLKWAQEARVSLIVVLL